MHPYALEQLARQKMAEDHATVARWRLARELREGRAAASAGKTGESLLERVITALRNAARPATRPSAGVS
jgi:hypothetical protein